jgi:hypothetical protein
MTLRTSLDFMVKVALVAVAMLLFADAYSKEPRPEAGPRSRDVVPTETVLAEKGQARLAIVVSKNTSETIRTNATVLASCLQKMTGATFAVEEGDGSSGIVLGRQEDFPALPKRFDADPSDRRRTEEYLLYTHGKGLLLVGAADLGAQDAMWDFLGRQGYRQYFPGPTWEIVPSVPRMVAAYDEVQKPSYIMRSVWFSGGIYRENGERYEDWRRKNRLVSGFYINAGHSYEGFIGRNKKVFLEHPEYYALVGGERKGPKLNIANPDLRRLFVQQSLEYLRAHPEQISVSTDPSDGGGWDESEEAKAIGSPSNQAVTLANEVADAVEKEFPGRYVGMYAYNQHAEPPTIRVRPNVFILVTTGFRGTLLSMSEQMEGWKRQGATLGIRDYLSYAAANYDVPARCRGISNLPGMARSFRNYHDWGARLYSGESGDNWGINGLLYYSVARVLWNVDDTRFMDGLFDEFLANCFGPVANEIRPYYAALSPAGNPVLEPGFLHRLYAAVEAARAKKPGDAVDARLDDLTLYVRYLELYRKYAEASGNERQKAAREMFSHLYRSRFHAADAGYAITRDLSGRDGSLRDGWSAEERKSFGQGAPLWEKRPPYERKEILAMSADGMKNNPQLDFQPVNFSKDLVPAASILEQDRDVAAGSLGGQAVHSILYYTWAEKGGDKWRIKVTCGTDPRGKPVERIRPRIELWDAKDPGDQPVSIAEMEIPAGKTSELVVESRQAGLHWLVLTGARWQKIELDPAKPWTVTSSSDAPSPSQGVAGTSTLYFYVPKGAAVIGAHIPGRGVLLDPDEHPVKNFDKDGYVKIDVPAGMDGRLWKVKDIRGGNFVLLTVPPYFAPSPRDLLLPREVVEAAKKKDGGLPVETPR